ncbi:MAG: FHA domain-containing protein [Deltaproteobacteria bacterium]|nr:FHA domain-containing protein [Deltaproteobacteria bacterium]
MKRVEIEVLSGEQAGFSVDVLPGSYRILRRSAESFDVRSTLISSQLEQWQLKQEDLELAAANLSQRAAVTGGPVISIEHFARAEDVAIWDERMSQPHAMLLVNGDGAMLVDMGSRNGSYVNGERIGAAMLKDGDLVRCGATRIHVHISG